MAREVDPRNTPRAAAALWMEAPMPMLTLFKTLDVTGLSASAAGTGSNSTC